MCKEKSSAILHTKDKKSLYFDLDILLTFEKLIGRKHMVVDRLNVNFQQMEWMKAEEMKYFDNLFVIVHIV
jgi:hypothetical protein